MKIKSTEKKLEIEINETSISVDKTGIHIEKKKKIRFSPLTRSHHQCFLLILC